MNRFRFWFANYMRGRYGSDEFNKFLIIVAFILIILDVIIKWRIINLAIIFILIYTYARMFSRNYNARYAENMKFLNMKNRFMGKFGRRNGTYGSGYKNPVNDGSHKILRCPACGMRLRVPKGAGNIMISCPQCGNKFSKKV